MKCYSARRGLRDRVRVRRPCGCEKEKIFDERRQFRERLGTVDRDAELRAAFEPLRVPRAERAELVDHPAIVTRRRWQRGPTWSGFSSKVALSAFSARARRDGSPRARGPARPSTARCSRAGTARAPRASRAGRAAPRAGPAPARESTGCAGRRGRRTHRSRPAAAARRSARARRSRPIRTPESCSASAMRATNSQSASAAVGLLRRPAVNRDCRRARIFDAAGHVRRVHLALVPALAHLDGDRDVHRLDHRRDDARRVRRLAHQAAARAGASRFSAPGSPCSRRRCSRPCLRRCVRLRPCDRDRRRRSGSRPAALLRCTRRTRACDRCRGPAPRC